MSDEREIMTWDIFGTASRSLAQMVADDGYEPDMVLAIARGGLLIGGAIGYALSVKNVYTMIVDDVADTGHTLRSVQEFVEGKVAEVRTGVLYEKSHSVVKCDYIWKRTDMWINFPWSDQDPVAKRDWSVKDA